MPTLVTIPFSHFCEKARWALDHARVDYQEEGHVPLLHRRAVARLSGRAGSVPVLVLDGDGVLDDSPLIVRWTVSCCPSAAASSTRRWRWSGTSIPSSDRTRDDSRTSICCPIARAPSS
jgi:glutathione S-transferase